MKLLLTSGGIKNNSIRNALVYMMGKPIEQSTALFIPTAAHPLGPFLVWRATQDFVEVPWKEFGVLELTLPCLVSRKKPGYRNSKPLMPCWREVAIPRICATGCSSLDWRTSCRGCARRSMWD